MKMLRLVALLVLVVGLAVPVVALQALSGSGNMSVGCTGAIDLGSSYTADRDNTGVGEEAYYFVATDGAGTTIHFFASAVTVGFSGPISSFGWNGGAPQYNPITLRFVSRAGNGFQEQLAGEWTGNCAGLPTFTPPFSGPGLPGNKNLVLFLGDTPILQSPGGEGTGLAMKTCQTAFVIDQKDGFARLFVMGGWVSLANTLDVPEEYGQPGSPVLPQCVGK
jgi:hypothetical protein